MRSVQPPRKPKGRTWKLRYMVALAISAVLALVTPPGARPLLTPSPNVVVTVRAALSNADWKSMSSAMKELLATLANLTTVLTWVKMMLDDRKQAGRKAAESSEATDANIVFPPYPFPPTGAGPRIPPPEPPLRKRDAQVGPPTPAPTPVPPSTQATHPSWEARAHRLPAEPFLQGPEQFSLELTGAVDASGLKSLNDEATRIARNILRVATDPQLTDEKRAEAVAHAEAWLDATLQRLFPDASASERRALLRSVGERL